MAKSSNQTPATGLEEFRAAILDYKNISSWAMGGSLAVPLVDYLTRLGPPWPWTGAVPIITSVAELLTLICVFHFSSRASRKTTSSTLIVLITLLVVSFGGYLYANSTYTFTSPVDGEKVVKGFKIRDDVAPMLRPDFTEEDALMGAEYRVEEVWTSSSITAARLILLVLWLFSFICLSAALAVFVLHHRRRRVTQRSAVPVST